MAKPNTVVLMRGINMTNKGKSILKWGLILIIVWVVVLSIVRFNMEDSFIENAKINAAAENHSKDE
jgi:hypothetical protein